MFAGGTRRHSASVGPAVRFGGRRSSAAAAAAAGERGLGASRERERERERARRRRRLQPGQLRAGVVARHASLHAAEDLSSVRATRVGG